MAEYDIVIHNGHIVTASDILGPKVHIGIKDGIIKTMTTEKITGTKVIDAEGAYITPGGIDAHVHLDQDDFPNGDTFETGTRSAIAGGTTSIIAFALQPKGQHDLEKAVDNYFERTECGAYCDYGFHLILSDPTPEVLKQLPRMVERGLTSLKVFTTYPMYKINDSELLDVLLETRKLKITMMIHAENYDVIKYLNEKLEQKKLTDPYYHAVSRPEEAEDEASYRVITLSKFVDTPILIVHMSCEASINHVENAQKKLLPVYAETCPQYLFLTSDYLKAGCEHHVHPEDPFEGAKYICSPPLRADTTELDGVWRKIQNGTVTIFSSDHAPSIYEHPNGKKRGLINGLPHYQHIPNGLSGVETRVPLLFCYGVETGRITPQRFVELCSTNPAKIYGLSETKGSIGVGMDADITIWYPKGKMLPFELTNEMLHHQIDHTAFAGMTFTNWPKYTVVRGELVWDRDNGGIVGKLGFGKFLKRGASALAGPRKELNPILA